MKKFLIAMFILSVTILLSIGNGYLVRESIAAEHEWKFAVEEPEGDYFVQWVWASRFKEAIEKYSKNTVKIELYPFGTLGPTLGNITELCMDGTVQFAFQAPGHLGSYIPEANIFTLHYLLPHDEKVINKVFEESPAIYRLLGEAYQEKNLKILTVITEGWHTWTANRPIRKLEDMKGFKMRVYTSKLMIESFKAYGANPSAIPFGELYGALQLNMVDGQTNPTWGITALKLYEVQDYVIKVYQENLAITMCANANFYKNLTDNQKQMVQNAILEVNRSMIGYAAKTDEWAEKEIKKIKPKMEIITLSSEESARFKKKSLVVREKYVEMTGPRGKRILETFLKEVEKAKAAF